MADNKPNIFDPFEKEKLLRQESESWNTTNLFDAQEGDIPILNLSTYFSTKSNNALKHLAAELNKACEEVGFFSIIGHGIDQHLIEEMFSMVKMFHQLDMDIKHSIIMDRPEWPHAGMGYLPFKNTKLPARSMGNLNEAFIIKKDRHIKHQDNQWLSEETIPGFRQVVEQYAAKIEQLALDLLPIYACALDLDKSFFREAFTSPMYRLRMTHYPPIKNSSDSEFGIAPHVDTTFITILAQDSPGLTIFSERRQCWIKAPLIKNGFIVNSGELLKQWTNDRFLSVKHFANNNCSKESRYSIPFFFNANSDFIMECIPTCCNEDNPSKYPPISYAQSQAVAQGE